MERFSAFVFHSSFRNIVVVFGQHAYLIGTMSCYYSNSIFLLPPQAALSNHTLRLSHVFTSTAYVLICSQIVYYSSPLVELQMIGLLHLQSVRNAAARLIPRFTCTPHMIYSLIFDHIHWLLLTASHVQVKVLILSTSRFLEYWSGYQVFVWPYPLALLGHLFSFDTFTWPEWSICPASEDFCGSATSLCNNCWPH